MLKRGAWDSTSWKKKYNQYNTSINYLDNVKKENAF